MDKTEKKVIEKEKTPNSELPLIDTKPTNENVDESELLIEDGQFNNKYKNYKMV